MSENLPKSFEELINGSDLPVLVDFWAEWCGACRIVGPTVQQVAKEYKGRLLTVKVNVDQKPHVAAKYQIQSIPTLMMFHRGEILMRLAGALPLPQLKAEIDQRLAGV